MEGSPGWRARRGRDTCTLVDDAELEAILPQAEEIEPREKRSLALHEADFLGEGFDTEEIPACVLPHGAVLLRPAGQRSLHITEQDFADKVLSQIVQTPTWRMR